MFLLLYMGFVAWSISVWIHQFRMRSKNAAVKCGKVACDPKRRNSIKPFFNEKANVNKIKLLILDYNFLIVMRVECVTRQMSFLTFSESRFFDHFKMRDWDISFAHVPIKVKEGWSIYVTFFVFSVYSNKKDYKFNYCTVMIERSFIL